MRVCKVHVHGDTEVQVFLGPRLDLPGQSCRVLPVIQPLTSPSSFGLIEVGRSKVRLYLRGVSCAPRLWELIMTYALSKTAIY